jgi:hypothetical protein
MIIPIAQYPFKGPHRSLRNIEDLPGVFIIISEFTGKHYLLDVDYSDEIKKAIEVHERRKCWQLYRKGLLRYAVLYESDFPSEPKEKIAKKVRIKYQAIPCGGNQR